jgi:N-acetylglucosamine-6-sulfatase
LDPYTYDYLNSVFQRNDEKPVSHKGEYSTDVLTGKVYGFLEDAVKGDKPFFLVAAPNAPHSNVAWNGSAPLVGGDFIIGPPVAAERHKHLFTDVIVPRTKHFNPEAVSNLLKGTQISRLTK